MTSELQNNELWWKGPKWLKDWKADKSDQEFDTDQEKRVKRVLLVQKEEEKFELLNKYSSWNKLITIVAWIYRFYNNIKNKTKNLKEKLTVQEMDDAMVKIVKTVQKKHFGQEVKELKERKELAPKHHIKSLDPILDGLGVLRVGGRTKNAQINYDQRHPIIMPYKHNVTDILIRHVYGIETMHGGKKATLGHLRTKFWILKGTSAVKQIINNCVKCKR